MVNRRCALTAFFLVTSSNHGEFGLRPQPFIACMGGEAEVVRSLYAAYARRDGGAVCLRA